MSDAQNYCRDLEAADAGKVDRATSAIKTGDAEGAEDLLMEVVRNCPREYIYEYKENGTLFVKFWTQDEFVHFVLWQKEQGIDQAVTWIPSAYPPAFFYLGFLNVKADQHEQAIALLDRGQSLEPTNPKFRLEKAQALMRLQRFEEALNVYREISTVNRYVSPHQLAAACRGRGFVLIETGDLDGAEVAFKESLEHEPQSDLAANELEYINHLRQGGMATGKDNWRSVATVNPSLNNCGLCGEPFESGKVTEFQGKTVAVCERCIKRSTRSWWQFWRR